MLVDNAIYLDGRRVSEPASIEVSREACRAHGGMAWLGFYEATDEEFSAVAQEFGLPDLAVEDAIHAHQRPKIERYGDILFVVLRAARYVDSKEMVDIGEIHIFIGPDFVITVRHAENPNLAAVRSRLENDPELLKLGSAAVLYGILDRVVDEYGPVIAGLEDDIDEIEAEVFGGEPDVSRRTYALIREVIDFQRAVKPLTPMLNRILDGIDELAVAPELRELYRDVEDHALRIEETVEAFRDVLQNILSVNLAIVGLQQNEEMKALSESALRQNDEVKRISAWAAILFAPTLVGTIYGMNFVHMPELDWRLGYPFALVLMFAVSGGLYLVFKRRKWLS
jgi:magnesium transporter